MSQCHLVTESGKFCHQPCHPVQHHLLYPHSAENIQLLLQHTQLEAHLLQILNKTKGCIENVMQRDGKCDDGSTLEEDMVFCDLGTDCHDCGNWTVEIPAYEADQDSLPIEFLHSRQVCPSSLLRAY